MSRAKGSKSPNWGGNLDGDAMGRSIEFSREIAKSVRRNKTDLYNYDQLCDRVDTYFDLCINYGMRPTLGDLAIVLGVQRQVLSKIASGNHRTDPKYAQLPYECVEEIRMAYASVGAIIEQGMLQGKINPVSGIFLAKNMGYKDYNTDFDREDSSQNHADLKELKQKYLNQLPDLSTQQGTYANLTHGNGANLNDNGLDE